MSPEERLSSAVSRARRIAPSDDAARRLTEKLVALGPPPVPGKIPLILKLGAPLLVVAAGLAYWQSLQHADAPPPRPAIVATAPVGSAAVAPTQSPDNSVSVEDLPLAKVPPIQTAQPKADPNAELDLVSRAESTLPSDPAGALALTQEHEKKYPNGQLVTEREVIAVEALAKLGRKTEAQRRSDELLARHPDSPYRVRLERALR